MVVCRKRGASGQEKIRYIKYLHCKEIAEESSLLNMSMLTCFRLHWQGQQSLTDRQKGHGFVRPSGGEFQRTSCISARCYSRSRVCLKLGHRVVTSQGCPTGNAQRNCPSSFRLGSLTVLWRFYWGSCYNCLRAHMGTHMQVVHLPLAIYLLKCPTYDHTMPPRTL